MNRMNLRGKGQALDGDRTTSGAVCIASLANYKVQGRPALRVGDATTPCPACNQSGTVVEGVPGFNIAGKLAVVDGALVACGCPAGSRVIAPLGAPAAQGAIRVVHPTTSASPSPTHGPLPARFRQSPASTPTQAREPGFYIVPRCMAYEEVLNELGAPQANLPRSLIERLNPTYQQGFKAGEIFVIGDGLSRPSITAEERHAMSAAQQARDALAQLTPEEAEYMMQNLAEIAGLLSDVSLALGVSQAMMQQALDEVDTMLQRLELLYQQQFSKHGHLRSPEFFTERQKLLKQLDKNLKMTLLNKRLNLGDYKNLRRDLGISSRSLVHHWSKAGAPGKIPGYSTHLDRLAKMTKYLKAGGNIGIAVGGVGSALKVADVCKQGNERACRKVKVTEASNFSGGLAGGIVGGKLGGILAAEVCVAAGPAVLVCGIVLTGGGALAGSLVGMSLSEKMGEVIFEALQDD